MSSRPPHRSNARDAPKAARTFLLREDLFVAFDARARELECSVDWLVGEAMKRLLAETGTGAPPRPVRTMSALPLPHPPHPPLPPPPPRPPPRPQRPTGSFVGQKPAQIEAIALRLGQKRAVVDRDRFVVGRGAKHAHFVVADPNVSRQHAMLERTGHGWIVIDMASTNGVLLNGTRVTRAALRAGDVLAIGPAEIVVERA